MDNDTSNDSPTVTTFTVTDRQKELIVLGLEELMLTTFGIISRPEAQPEDVLIGTLLLAAVADALEVVSPLEG